jgi:lipopolysaccharide export LptBFGC system permease protein LptF
MVFLVFCGLWYGGFYVSEFWIRIIDMGAPWSWLVALVVASFTLSFRPLRKDSRAVAKSLIGPLVVGPAFWLWIDFCSFLFDPCY